MHCHKKTNKTEAFKVGKIPFTVPRRGGGYVNEWNKKTICMHEHRRHCNKNGPCMVISMTAKVSLNRKEQTTKDFPMASLQKEKRKRVPMQAMDLFSI